MKHTLNLIDDGRDISRLVDCMGNEIRTRRLLNGKLLAYTVDTDLDEFTTEDWDMVLSEGNEHTLDAIAGTTFTYVNW